MSAKSPELLRLERLLAKVDGVLERLRGPGQPATAGQGLPGDPGEGPMTAAQVAAAVRGIQSMFEGGRETTTTVEAGRAVEGQVARDIASFLGAGGGR